MPIYNNTDQDKIQLAMPRGHMWSVFLFSVFVNLLMLTGPLFMLQVYDRVLGSRSEETLAALFVLVAALFLLMGLIDYARGRVLSRIGAQFQERFAQDVFRAVLVRDRDKRLQDVPGTGLSDLDAIRSFYASPVLLALFDLPWTPVFLAAIFIFHPFLGWLAMAGGAILITLTLVNHGLTRRRTGMAQHATMQSNAFAGRIRDSADLVHAQGMSGSLLDRWRRTGSAALEMSVQASDWTGLFSTTSKTLRLFLQSAMLALGAWLVLQGNMTAGAMIAASIMLGRALAPIEQVIGQWALFQRARDGWKALRKLFDAVPPATVPVALPRPKARLHLKGVTVCIPGTTTPLLHGISLQIEPGQVLGVIGRSGSGKSTLARTVLGLTHPIAGEVRLGGATLDQIGPEALGAHVGYLPQELAFFPGTVAENIARMTLEPDDAMVVRAAEAAGAHDVILSLKDGYQTRMDAGDKLLSGGQRQRIALARALYGDPVLLVLDEPNSALDGEGSEALNRAIRDFKSSDRAVLIMTHRPMAISECNTLAVIEAGRIQAIGPRDEVLQSMVKNAGVIQRNLPKTAP